MATPTADEPDSELGWGVGSVASRLGIAASTLRTWERRYDVGPSRRTVGGHRRYTEVDINRVILTQALIARGAPPSDAARVAHSLDADGLADALDAEQEQAVGGDPAPAPVVASEVVAALIEAAVDDDPQRIARLVRNALRSLRVTAAWTDVFAPTLIQIGHEWSQGRLRIEAEHFASEAILGELRAHTRRAQGVDRSGPTVILASADEDQHSLPVFALEAALADRGVGVHVLGARLPASALADVTERLRPRVVFLWASLARPVDDPVWEVLAALGDGTTPILGGPGWPPASARPVGDVGAPDVSDLGTTVDRILDLVGQG